MGTDASGLSDTWKPYIKFQGEDEGQLDRG